MSVCVCVERAMCECVCVCRESNVCVRESNVLCLEVFGRE